MTPEDNYNHGHAKELPFVENLICNSKCADTVMLVGFMIFLAYSYYKKDLSKLLILHAGKKQLLLSIINRNG